MDNHSICREILKLARKEAKDAGISVPKHMTALESSGQYFIEADGIDGEWVSSGMVDCVCSAKAHFISALVEKGNARSTDVASSFNGEATSKSKS